MIDEKKLDKEIADWFKKAIDNGNHEVDTVDTSAVVRHIIDKQPRVGVPDTNVGEWIPCGKEKPRGGENIATVKWYDGTIEVVHAYYDGFDWITGCGERAEVIAWMPLPPAYKEGE